MKKIFVLLSMLIAISANANCTTDFNTGASQLNFGVGQYDSGVSSYNAAVAESKKPTPNFSVLCHHLVDSISGFKVASESFLECQKSFTSASRSCTDADRVRAKEYAKMCKSNKGIASRNLATMRDTLEQTCFGSGLYNELDESILK